MKNKSAAALGRLGGLAKSKRKAAASRENGRAGGRACSDAQTAARRENMAKARAARARKLKGGDDD